MPAQTSTFVDDARAFLEGMGYQSAHLASNYEFSHPSLSGGGYEKTRIDLAGFHDFPHTMRNACIGVSELRGTEVGVDSLLRSLRYLAVPVALVSTESGVQLWPVRLRPPERPLAESPHGSWRESFSSRLADLSPDSIALAKQGQRSLVFVDADLHRWAEQATEGSLQKILTEALRIARDAAPSRLSRQDENGLVQLVFQLFASRVLQDKLVIDATNAPAEALKRAKDAYPRCFDALISERLRDAAAESYRKVAESYRYESVNSDMLGYIYENTLVSPQSRYDRGIYYTPQAIANYVLDAMPIENIRHEDRYVYDPCCGSGSFLLAAFARLSSTLPGDWTPARRHQYLQQRLMGGDVDAFAVGIARLSLVLADSTSKDGWEVNHRDALDNWNGLPTTPRIVVTNPPFKEEKNGDRQELAANILKHIIDSVPDESLIGIVLPTSALESSSAIGARQAVLDSCNVLEIDLFPSSLFESSTETSVWMLRKCRGAERTMTVMIRELKSADVPRFINSSEYSRSYPADQFLWAHSETNEFVFSPLQELWESVESRSIRLGDVATINTGLQIYQHDKDRVQATPRAGDKPFVGRLDVLKPFCFLCEQADKPYLWIKYEPSELRRKGYVEMYEQPKVLINSNRNPASAWRIVAAVARKPVYFSDNFHGVQPNATVSVPVEVLAAVLNSHIANGWLDAHSRKRKLVIETLYEIPFPRFSHAEMNQIVDLERQLEQGIAASLDDPGGLFYQPAVVTMQASELLSAIDACVFQAYGLTADERRRVEKFMSVDKRPG